jgi:OOP family OmpA-OmpF porin
MNHLRLGTVFMAALAAAGVSAAHAQTEAASAPSEELITEVFDHRWFFTPQIGVIFSDQSDFDRGIAYGLSAGRPYNENFAFEFTLERNDLETDNAGDYERTGLSAQALWFPFTPFLESGGSFHPYALAGVQGAQIDFLGEKLGGYGPLLGGGLIQDLGGFQIRLDARYRIDYVKEEGVVPDENFYTWVASLGVVVPFGEKPMPPNYDDDGDGVPNNRDKCPNTPPGVKVGPDGCPLDSDGDGVPDTYDKCPNTPKGVKVNADGCPLDSDGDGIPDNIDKCPNTPKGVIVNAEGCPLDSDGDGVPDGLDQCPNTLPGVKVNSRGCAIPQIVELRGVHFEFDKSTLLLDSKAILDRVAISLQSEPDVRVLIAGHTDALGSDEYNQRLSQARAQSVVDYLASKGVPAERMLARGYGESQPVAPNTHPDGSDNEEGREHNRRTEMHFLEGEKNRPEPAPEAAAEPAGEPAAPPAAEPGPAPEAEPDFIPPGE